MSLKITVNEEPRKFSVRIGSADIGRVTSYFEKGEDNDEAYWAERTTDDDDIEYESIGYYATLKEASLAVVEYEYGDGRIDKVTERLV
jgi:hypothetical protein